MHTVAARSVAEQPRLLHHHLDGGKKLYYIEFQTSNSNETKLHHHLQPLELPNLAQILEKNKWNDVEYHSSFFRSILIVQNNPLN